MIGRYDVVFITGGQRTANDGKVYSSITVMQGEDVLKMSCSNEVYPKFTGQQFKPLTIEVALKEYSGDKSYSCVGIVSNK